MSHLITEGLGSQYIVTAGFNAAPVGPSGNLIIGGLLTPFLITNGYVGASISPPYVYPTAPTPPSGIYISAPIGSLVNNGRGTILSPGGFRALVDQRLMVQFQPPVSGLNQKLQDQGYYTNRKNS